MQDSASRGRWTVAVLLLIVTAINFIDRQALSVAAPVVLRVFELSSADYGLLTGAFLLAYGLGQLFSGRIGDALGSHRTLALAAALWSVAALGHAFAIGFASLLVARFMLGLFESANYPMAVKAVAETFPPSDRGFAVGIVNAGPGLGAMLAPPLLGALILAHSWQAAFVVPAIAGMIWAVIWWRLYRPASQGAPSTPSPLARQSLPWSYFLRKREVRALLLARFVGDGTQQFFTLWLPLFLATQRGLDLRQIAIYAWIPFVFSDIGSIGGGWMSRVLARRGWSIDAARKTLIWVGAALVPIGILATVVESHGVAIACLCGTQFASNVRASALFSLPADLFRPAQVGTVWGMFGAAGAFGAALSQPLIGAMIDRWSYAPVFVIVSLLPAVAASIITIGIRRIELLPDDPGVVRGAASRVSG